MDKNKLIELLYAVSRHLGACSGAGNHQQPVSPGLLFGGLFGSSGPPLISQIEDAIQELERER